MPATQTKQASGSNGTAKGLYPKLAAAIAEVDRVAKDGRNDHFKYSFTSAEEIYRVVRGPLLDRGLVLIPEVSGANGEGDKTVLALKFLLIDSESGETLEREWIGEGQDRGDKGPYKAMTGGAKTFLRHLFMLPADDDPESDPTTDKDAEKGATPKARATAKKGTRPATAKQKGKLNALFAGAELPAAATKALIQWTSGQPVMDRLSSKQASALIDALGEDGSGAHGLMGKLQAAAAEGDEKAIAAANLIEDDEGQIQF